MIASRTALILAAMLAAGVAEAQPPPPYPNPPPYPPYPGTCPSPVVGPWPANGIVVCDAPGGQTDFSGTDDYAHGAYFAWSDHRGTEAP